MTVAEKVYNKIKDKEFSYGETLYHIVEEKGIALTPIPREDFVFPDNSVLRLTNKECKVMTLLIEYKEELKKKTQKEYLLG